MILPLLVLVVLSSCSATECTCNDQDDDTCERLLALFERSLLANGGNVYKIRNLLFPPTEAVPELINITYRLNFVNHTENATISVCPCPKSANITEVFNTSLLSKPLIYQYGWTTIGLYKYIHPALLNQLQPQMPFVIMQITQLTINPFSYLLARDPEAVDIPFLWDGCSSLPSVTLDLSVPLDDLTCLPARTEVDAALKTLTNHVRI